MVRRGTGRRGGRRRGTLRRLRGLLSSDALARDERGLNLSLLLRRQTEKQLLRLLLTHGLGRVARRLRTVGSESLLMMLRRVEDRQLGDRLWRQSRSLRCRTSSSGAWSLSRRRNSSRDRGHNRRGTGRRRNRRRWRLSSWRLGYGRRHSRRWGSRNRRWAGHCDWSRRNRGRRGRRRRSRCCGSGSRGRNGGRHLCRRGHSGRLRHSYDVVWTSRTRIDREMESG